METKRKLSNLGIGILFTLFFISIGVILVINCRNIYRHDIKALNLVEQTGYSQEEIIKNYDALIDYCSPFNKGELRFPTLPSSESALSHFKEVKDIFIAFYFIAIITGIMLVMAIFYKRKKKDYGYLRTSSITCIVLPLLVGAACAINFDQTFILFHKLFFNNDDWLFDPITDPIILLLPEEFFLHCAIFIVIFVLLGSGILYLLYRRHKKQEDNK
ncbi:MAG: TIGR01906 family membrane protein [bacterium]|nr:TIGR01906 family membrane protein [bacterium]